MQHRSYISVAFRSLPREFKTAINEQKRNDLEELLAKAKYSAATKLAARHYFDQYASTTVNTPSSNHR